MKSFAGVFVVCAIASVVCVSAGETDFDHAVVRDHFHSIGLSVDDSTVARICDSMSTRECINTYGSLDRIAQLASGARVEGGELTTVFDVERAAPATAAAPSASVVADAGDKASCTGSGCLLSRLTSMVLSPISGTKSAEASVSSPLSGAHLRASAAATASGAPATVDTTLVSQSISATPQLVETVVTHQLPTSTITMETAKVSETKMQPLRYDELEMRPRVTTKTEMQPIRIHEIRMEPKVVDTVKVQPVKIQQVRMEPRRVETVKMQPIRVQEIRMVPKKVETVKMQPIRSSEIHLEPKKTESIKMQPIHVQELRMEPRRFDTVSMQPVKVEEVHMEPHVVSKVKVHPIDLEHIRHVPRRADSGLSAGVADAPVVRATAPKNVHKHVVITDEVEASAGEYVDRSAEIGGVFAAYATPVPTDAGVEYGYGYSLQSDSNEETHKSGSDAHEAESESQSKESAGSASGSQK